MPANMTILPAAKFNINSGKTAWGRLEGAARALAIAEAAAAHPGLSLVITRDMAMADRLERELHLRFQPVIRLFV